MEICPWSKIQAGILTREFATAYNATMVGDLVPDEELLIPMTGQGMHSRKILSTQDTSSFKSGHSGFSPVIHGTMKLLHFNLKNRYGESHGVSRKLMGSIAEYF